MMSPIHLKLIILMVCVALKVVGGEHEIKCLEREREALLRFKASLHDPSGMLSSWTTVHCCQWKGIRCNNLTGNIVSLDLHGEYDYDETQSGPYISGEIHESLVELQQLKYLNISHNYFSNIPEFLASLSNLRYLDLSWDYFDGKIPSQFGSLSHLKYLNLAGNDLEGSIPPQLGNLSKLQYLDLSYNYFEGNIPSQLGNLPKLEHLDLSSNYFEGNIPSELGNLSNLQQLYLEGSYNGVLEINEGGKWLSNLISLTHLYLISIHGLTSSHSWLQKLPKLRELGLIDCSLSDHFILSSRPSKFNVSTSLLAFDLSQNTFTSPMIFKWVTNITSNLVELDLAGNNLKDSVSNHFGMAMNSLQHLDLSFNNFKGDVLKSFMNICTLQSLNMTENNLSEDLPSILHHLSSGCIGYSLQDLDLTHNRITGSLSNLSTFPALKSLYLSRNQLNGKIAKGNKLPTQLEILSISENFLEGGIPKSFGNACALHSFDMDGNNLSDELSLIIHHLSGCTKYSLQELSLEANQINGTLPDLSTFSALKSLDLSFNRLNGKITEGTKLPTQLESLSIRSNFLEGGIPKSFGNACTLSILDMSNNSLSDELSTIIHHLSGCAKYSLQGLNLEANQINGTLPDLSTFPALKSLYLSRNQLNGKIAEGNKLPTQLEILSISENFLEGGIPKSFGNACALHSFDMDGNNLSDELSLIIHHLSGCTKYSLQELSLEANQINGTLPDLSTFSALKSLDLSFNRLNGKITEGTKLPTQLESLSIRSNFLEGGIPKSFGNACALSILDMSNNSLSDELSTIIHHLSGCAKYSLQGLNLEANQINGTLPDLSTFSALKSLDLSFNRLNGKIT
ncbi:hypothetical protein V8G54_013243 [Vigna mungo]|uniref:Leucine-rich repeat-containing N-terminal plant-type domain-containing protein n=1 Tax=Vigna mungo TaxID=3915 RepID=A0AAQ3S332_VIGMU